MASKLVLISVIIFNVIAFGLAIAAEQRRSTGKVKQDADEIYTYCVYDSDIASGFGVGAFLFLLLSQIIVMVATGCFCCGRPLRPGGARAWAIVLFLICWIFFVIAEACLLAGSVRNARHLKYWRMVGGNKEMPSCKTVRKGVFAAGAAFVLLATTVSEFYYVSYSKAKDSFQPYGRDTGVGMGTYK